MERFLDDGLIRLRAVEPTDVDMMWQMETDSSQWRENGMSAPYSRANLKEYAENYDADPVRAGQLRLVGELKENGDVFGLIDLYDISPTGRTAFVGIYVMAGMRGRGYAPRSLSLLEDYASRLLNLRILGAKVVDTNKASRRLFEDAGYMKCGELPGWILTGRESNSLLIYTKALI